MTSVFPLIALLATTPQPEARPPAQAEPPGVFERGGGEPIEPTRAAPVRGAEATLNVPDLPDAQRATLPPEGTYIARVAGTVLRLESGDYAFLPDRREDAPPPMLLLPCQRLATISSGLNARNASRSRASIGGQAHVYRGRLFLLPTVFAFGEEQASGAEKPAETPAAPSRPGPESDEARRIIEQLEEASPRRRVLSPTENAAVDAAEDRPPDASAMLAEGTMIVRERGRLVRMASDAGHFAFAIDNDHDSPAPAPLPLVAGSILQQVEEVAAQQGQEIAFEMTGRVLTYRERNYLLPIFFQVARQDQVKPNQ
ncbi:MAG TPA: hypothetical protein VD971_04080 [Phycisphaerales bacterium]|nr:hypothetical protein [Phycisphaerales bacterium]